MHDCCKTQEQLIDLVFDEVSPVEKKRLLAEVEHCQVCAEQYHSMARTLDVFDQATEAAQPQDSYWLAYDAKLRAKLVEVARPSFLTRLWQSITSFRIGSSAACSCCGGTVINGNCFRSILELASKSQCAAD